MPCPEQNTLLAFSRGELPANESAGLESHLDGCPDCRRLLVDAASENTIESQESAEPGRAPASLFEPLAQGELVGRFVIRERLGSGGMGLVYAAYDPELDRRVALKLIRVDGDSPESQARMIKEAQATARVQHPNVVALHEVGRFGGSVFLAMELVEGKSLRAWLKEKVRTAEEVLPIMIQAGQGLAAAHGAGIIHRDFKPANVLVGRDGRVRITDFGLARRMTVETHLSGERGLAPLSLRTRFAGTPAYMAPEQLHGDFVDVSTDQYSFCVTLFEALTGRRPTAVSDEDSNALGDEWRRLPRALVAPLRRGLARDRQRRFSSMTELLAAIRPLGRVRRRRVAMLMVVGLVLGVVGASVTQGLMRRRALASCRDMSERLSGVWDFDERARLERAFRATGYAGAAESFHTVAQALEAYASRWTAAQTEACLASRVRHEQSEALYAQRTLCLERRLQDFGALTNVLARADAHAVARAPQAALGLSPVSDCSSPSIDSGLGAADGDPHTRALLAQYAGTLSRVKVEYELGQWARSLEDAQTARGLAQTAGSGADLATALYWVGANQRHLEDPKGAEESFYQSFFAAERVPADAIAVQSLAALVHMLAPQVSRRNEAQRLAGQALSISARMPADPASQQLVYGSLADFERERGALPEAIKGFRTQIDLIEQAQGVGSPQLGSPLERLGQCLLQHGDLAEANAALTRALLITESTFGARHPLAANLNADLGNLAFERGRFGEAAGYDERALEISRQTYPPPSLYVGIALANAAKAHFLMGKQRQGLEEIAAAVAMLELVERPAGDTVAATRLNQAELLVRSRDDAGAKATLARVQEQVDANPGSELAVIADSLGGELARREGDLPTSLERHARAIAALPGVKNLEGSEVPMVKASYGAALLDAHRVDDALTQLEAADALWQKRAGFEEDVARTRLDLARALYERGRDPARALALAREVETATAPFNSTLRRDATKLVATFMAPRPIPRRRH